MAIVWGAVIGLYSRLELSSRRCTDTSLQSRSVLMRSRLLLLAFLAVSGSSVSRDAVADDRPRRVLIMDSFARGVAPFSEYILAFRSELRDRWPWAAGPVRGVARVGAISGSGRRCRAWSTSSRRVLPAIRWTWLRCSVSQPCGLPAATESGCFPTYRCSSRGWKSAGCVPEFLGEKTAAVCDRIRSHAHHRGHPPGAAGDSTDRHCLRRFSAWSDSGALKPVARSNGSRTECSSGG